jgi:hypothetical protein
MQCAYLADTFLFDSRDETWRVVSIYPVGIIVIIIIIVIEIIESPRGFSFGGGACAKPGLPTP